MAIQLSPLYVLSAFVLSFVLFVIGAIRFLDPVADYGSKRSYRLTASDHLKRRGSF
ncbi:hypothetical protein PtB15_7B207 [Puccinia triticina]|nr:hypothetical protein PtB15_7B207 [Puccinia triticina]